MTFKPKLSKLIRITLLELLLRYMIAVQYNGRCPLTYLDAPATPNMSQEYTPHYYRNMTNRHSALLTTVVHRLMEFKLYSNTIISHKKKLES